MDVWQKIEKVAEGGAENETVPELVYDVCRAARGGWIGSRRRHAEEVGEVLYAHQASSKRGALLVERGGLGGSLVESCVGSDGGVDVWCGDSDERLFAPCGGGHGLGRRAGGMAATFGTGRRRE